MSTSTSQSSMLAWQTWRVQGLMISSQHFLGPRDAPTYKPSTGMRRLPHSFSCQNRSKKEVSTLMEELGPFSGLNLYEQISFPFTIDRFLLKSNKLFLGACRMFFHYLWRKLSHNGSKLQMMFKASKGLRNNLSIFPSLVSRSTSKGRPLSRHKFHSVAMFLPGFNGKFLSS